MNPYDKSIDDLAALTGLTRKYIDKCYRRMEHLLSHYRRPAPDGNKWLYDSNAVIAFQQIRALKDQGLSLPEIRSRMEVGQGSGVETAKKPGKNAEVGGEIPESPQGSGNEEAHPREAQGNGLASETLRAIQEISAEATREVIKAKDQVIGQLHQQTKLLEASREEVARRAREKEAEIEALRTERSRLEHDLFRLTGGEPLGEVKRKREHERYAQKRRRELLARLPKAGWRERKRVISELLQLDETSSQAGPGSAG